MSPLWEGSIRDRLDEFFTNMDQPGMPEVEKWSKFFRNRFHAFVLMKGCCGNDGEPGC